MAGLDDLTVLKIRGKRRGVSTEKWNTGKRRDPELQVRRTPFDEASPTTNRAGIMRPRKAQQTTVGSPLETLPAEVLQQIFEDAGNLDLAVVSRQLAAKLSHSLHLQNELATRLLKPVLGHDDHVEPDDGALKAATRLLNSRFMTWQFFTAWLGRQPCAVSIAAADNTEPPIWTQLWVALRPCPTLMPPRKLFIAPFTPDKLSFLSVLLQGVTDIAAHDPSYGEIAYEGLVAAVQTGPAEMVSLLLGVGLGSDTELLRTAVEAGCDEEIVQLLVQFDAVKQRAAGRSKGEVDLLDPVVWSWAEQARKRGDDRGDWLVSYLQEMQRKNIPSR